MNFLRGRPRRAPWGEETSLWTEGDWDWFYGKRLLGPEEITPTKIEDSKMDAWISVLRTVLLAGATWATAKGWLVATDAGPIVAAVTASVAPLAALAVTIWGAYTHTRAAKIAAAGALPNVAVVISRSEKEDYHPDAPGVVAEPISIPPAVAMAMSATR